MRQVLLNLLENALKFTPDGGEVTLTLLHRTSQWVQVSVCDTGPGIPRGEQQRIFLERVRLPQTSGTTSGFGVGLLGVPPHRRSAWRANLGGFRAR